jgi:hypothetical protein
LEQARINGVEFPDKGASGYDSPGFAAAKAAVREQMRAHREGRN